MGLELAELRLLEALRSRAAGKAIDIRVVGGRGARRHAERLGGRWIPAQKGTFPRRASHNADLVHLLGLDLPPPSREAFIAMVHDVSPLVYKDEGVLPPWTDEIMTRASLLLTPSAFTAAELERLFGVERERIRVVGGAPVLEAKSAEPLTPRELKELGIKPPFALRYGGYTTRKNVPLLLDAWTGVPTGTLVLTGPAQSVRAKVLSEAPSLDRVVVLDYVSEGFLGRLLRSAALLVTTSQYEGFGLPPLEAFAAGTPVVAVSTPFVREVCGDAGYLVDDSPGAIAAALERLMSDRDLCARQSELGFQRAACNTWDKTADIVLRAYGSALSSQLAG